jgi:hypothetical protein
MSEESLINEVSYQKLVSFGNFFPLKPYIFVDQVEAQLTEFETHWQQYNKFKTGFGRFGLSVTSADGGLSGEKDLTSLGEYNRVHGTDLNEFSFRTPTEVYKKCTAIHPLILELEPYLCRTHFIRFQSGGYFPYHRDAYGGNNHTFRIFVPLYRHSPRDFIFLLGEQRISMEIGRPYFINTRIEHALMVFDGPSLCLVLNVECRPESVDKVLSLIFSI